MIETLIGEIVEENAADAARLAAVAQLEILVAPALVARVVLCAEGGERVAAQGMEVARVLGEAVVGRKVHAAAEPPRVAGAEAAHLHVHRRSVWIARMQHERQAHRAVPTSGKRRPRGRSGRWERTALHARDVDAGALEERAFLQDARDTA